MRFSIIIPVYNVENYIRRCMDSVMNQTFSDYEVIVVDDESPDNSMQIVAEFADAFPGKITMIHQKNTRQGGARNNGVTHAKGEYILFVDSDDYVSPDLLQTLDEQLKIHDCDILAFKYRMVTSEGHELQDGGFGSLAEGLYHPREDKQIVMLPVGPVHKAYRRSFYLDCGFRFPERILYEDAMTRVLVASASGVYLHDAALYYYVQSPNSSMRQKPSERMLDILTVTDLVADAFRQRGLYEDFRQPLESSLVGGILYVLEFVNRADPSSRLQDAMMDYIRDKFPACLENPFLDPDVWYGLNLLLKGKYRMFHILVIRGGEVKSFLKRWKVISELNRFRRKLMGK